MSRAPDHAVFTLVRGIVLRQETIERLLATTTDHLGLDGLLVGQGSPPGVVAVEA